ADAAGFCQGFKARGDVDAVAIDVARFDDHVTEVDAQPKEYVLLLGRLSIAVGHSTLNLNSASHRSDHAGKLREHSIASVLYDSTAVLLDLWIDQLAEMHFEPVVCALFVLPHEPRIAGDIGGEDRRKAAGRGHGSHL